MKGSRRDQRRAWKQTKKEAKRERRGLKRELKRERRDLKRETKAAYREMKKERKAEKKARKFGFGARHAGFGEARDLDDVTRGVQQMGVSGTQSGRQEVGVVSSGEKARDA